MKHSILLAFLFLPFCNQSFAQNHGDYRTAADGIWSDINIWQKFNIFTLTWNPAAEFPDNVDTVTVNILNNVVQDVNIYLGNLLIKGQGKLKVKGTTITIGHLSILSGATLTLAANGRIHGTAQATLDLLAGGSFYWMDGNLSGNLVCDLQTQNFDPNGATFYWGASPDTLFDDVTVNLRLNTVLPVGKKVYLADLNTNFNLQFGALTFRDSEFYGLGGFANFGEIKSKLDGISKVSCNFIQSGGMLNVVKGAFEIGGLYFGSGDIRVNRNAVLQGSPIENNCGTITNRGLILNPLKFSSGSLCTTVDGNGGEIKTIHISNDTYLNLVGKQTVSDSLLLPLGAIIGSGELTIGGNAILDVGLNGICAVPIRRFVPNDGSEILFPYGFNTGSAPYAYYPIKMSVPVSAAAGEFFTVFAHPVLFKKYNKFLGPRNCFVGSGPIVHLSWAVLEDTPGGSTADLTVEWKGSDEDVSFDRNTALSAQYIGNKWALGAPLPITGADPYTMTFTGLTEFSVFGVMDTLPNWNCGTKPTAPNDADNRFDQTLSFPQNPELFVYPNPTKAALHFGYEGFSDDTPSVLTLLDISGSVVFSKKYLGNYLDLGNLEAGFYVLKIEQDGKSSTTKILKQ